MSYTTDSIRDSIRIVTPDSIRIRTQTADSQISSIGLYLAPTQMDVIPTNLNRTQPKTHMRTRVCSNNIIVCVLCVCVCVCVCRLRSDIDSNSRSVNASNATHQRALYAAAVFDGPVTFTLIYCRPIVSINHVLLYDETLFVCLHRQREWVSSFLTTHQHIIGHYMVLRLKTKYT